MCSCNGIWYNCFRFLLAKYTNNFDNQFTTHGLSLEHTIVILLFLSICYRFCTSIVAQDTKGRIYHGRNLDYPHIVLKNLTIDIQFIKNGEVTYDFLSDFLFCIRNRHYAAWKASYLNVLLHVYLQFIWQIPIISCVQHHCLVGREMKNSSYTRENFSCNWTL